MNYFDVVKKLCGILMAAGTAVLLLMLSDLLYKAIVIGSDALDAAIHDREKKDPRLLLYSGITDGIHRGNGSTVPLSIAAVLGCMYFRIKPGKESVIPVLLILVWGIAVACYSNIRYYMNSNSHSALFIRKFFASFVTLQDRDKAFDAACAAIPDGDVRGKGISAGKLLAKGVTWKKAMSIFDNGIPGGKTMVICMNLPDNVQQKSDESVFGYFARTLSEEASECRKRIQSTSAASFMLLISILMYSVISLYNINSGLSAIRAAVLLSAGLFLCGMTFTYRNALIEAKKL